MTEVKREKLNQEVVIRNFIKIHGNKYSYDKFVFTKSVEKSVVTCKDHGDFEVSYSNHAHKVNPRGCPTCGEISRASKRTKPFSYYLHKFLEVHGDKYSYVESSFINSTKKMSVVCKNHGIFLQSPEKHIAGKGCPACAGKGAMTASRFKQRAKKAHGDLYSYELIADSHFKSKNSKVPIICKSHGVFWQNHHNHSFGQGCRKCAKNGFNINKSGVFYILTEGNRVKVGITNRNVYIRLKEINRSGCNFNLYKFIPFEIGKDCADFETAILRLLRSNFKNSNGDFDGVTESFEDVDIYLLTCEIESLRNKNDNKKETN